MDVYELNIVYLVHGIGPIHTLHLNNRKSYQKTSDDHMRIRKPIQIQKHQKQYNCKYKVQVKTENDDVFQMLNIINSQHTANEPTYTHIYP